MKKIDFKKELKHLYKPTPKKVESVTVPVMNFLMIDGKGDPNTSQKFMDAIDALYPVAYALKFMVKKGGMEIDYGVLPLEGLWWADDMDNFSVDRKEDWKWALMIMQPEFIAPAMVEEAIEQVKSKKNPVSLPQLRFESYEEGEAAQIMHIGPFSEEGPTIEKVHAFIEENGYERRGRHHEIYLSDTRKADPAKWKTIIRQPYS